jgi:galactonate dehydratase
VRKGDIDVLTGPGLEIELNENAMANQIGHVWRNRESYDSEDGSVMDW